MLPLKNWEKRKEKKEKENLPNQQLKHYLKKRFLLLNSPTSTNHSLVPTPQPLLRFFHLSRPIISNTVITTVIAVEILIIELL